MENCKTDNIAEKPSLQKLLKIGYKCGAGLQPGTYFTRSFIF